MTVLLVSLPSNVETNKTNIEMEEELNLQLCSLIDSFLEGNDYE